MCSSSSRSSSSSSGSSSSSSCSRSSSSSSRSRSRIIVVVSVVGKAAAVVCGSDPSTLVRASSNLYCCSGTSLQLQMLPRNNRISNGHIGGHLWGGQNLLSICLCGFHDDDKTELLRTI